MTHNGAPLELKGSNPGEWGIELAHFLVQNRKENSGVLEHHGDALPAMEGVMLCGGWVPEIPTLHSGRVRQAPDSGFFPVSALEWPWGSSREVMVLDMGKSCMKIGYCGFFRRLARNFDKFPVQKARPRERARWRREVAAFAGRKLAAVVREAGRPPKTIEIGFSGKVSPQATPLEEVYPGLADWEEAANQIVTAAGLENCEVIGCSATELAAWAALQSPISQDWSRFAVVTMGTSLSLALVCRDGWR